jgi:DNA-damage-inducible protein J
MNTTIQIRIDQKTKREARKVFENIGLDMSSGVKLYLTHVVNTGSMPFTPRTKNGFTSEQEQQMLRETEHAIKYGKDYSSVEEMHKAILSK